MNLTLPRIVALAAWTLPTLVLIPGSSPVDAAVRANCNGKAATIVGTHHADRIVGTPRCDVVVAGAGSDLVVGDGGDDLICRDSGDHQLYRGNGTAEVCGNPVRDAMGDDTENLYDLLRGARGWSS